MQVASRVAQVLRQAGIETIFGLLGDGNLHHLLAFISEQQGRFVSTVSEGGAVSAADGASRTTGGIGVASVTHGPGLTNTLTALTEAVRAHSRLLVLTGDTSSAESHHLQAFDLRALSGAAGAEYVRITSPATAADQVAGVVRRLQAASAPRPVVLDVAVDLAMRGGAEESSSPLSSNVPATVPNDLDAALGVIATARRPLVLAGRGALHAREEILELAGVLGAPAATTLLGRGLFSGSEHDLGTSGTVGDPKTLDAIMRSDCLVVFGASLNRFTTADGATIRDRAVVQVDTDRATLAQCAATHPLMGDSAATASAMASQLTDAGHVPAEWNSRAIDMLDGTPREPAQTAPGTIDLGAAMDLLDRSLPEDRLVVSDTGRFIYTTWRRLGVKRPASFVHTLNFASIGLGIATGVGVAVAHPDRLTAVVVGDGGGMMGIGELATAVREKLRLMVVVANDAAYGMEHHTLAVAGLDPAHAHLKWPDFAGLAAGYGAQGHTATSLTELSEMLEDIGSSLEGPVLIDLRLDRDAISGD